ncbi:MAG: SH3 domain-containing protein [Anaerolineae bacterium]
MKAIVVFACMLASVLLLACSSSTPLADATFLSTPTLEPAATSSPIDFPPSPTATVPLTPQPQITGVATDVLNVRAGPGINYAIKSQLKEGDTITITGKSADGIWWQFSGGWVSSTYIRVNGDPTVIPVATPSPSSLD